MIVLDAKEFKMMYVFNSNISKLSYNPENITPRCSILVTPCIMKPSDAHRNEIAQ